MIRHLNANVSFCELDGRLFFLDIQKDRYFQLSEAAEQSFRSYLEAEGGASVSVSGLIKHNLLSQITARPSGQPSLDLPCPSQSTLEVPYPNGRVPLDAIRDVFLAVSTMRFQLKARRLKSVLQALAAYRDRKTSTCVEDQTQFRQHLSDAAITFNRVRPYIPIEMCCLVDSLSMVRFLAKRGLRAYLVMGVACDPFSAHAWAQHGPLVLNDTVGAVQTYIPIRVT